MSSIARSADTSIGIPDGWRITADALSLRVKVWSLSRADTLVLSSIKGESYWAADAFALSVIIVIVLRARFAGFGVGVEEIRSVAGNTDIISSNIGSFCGANALAVGVNCSSRASHTLEFI